MNKQHLNITVSGRVQGVYYRASTKAVADQLSVRGWVQNKPDGTVYIEAEADAFFMNQFLEWCTEGPNGARVEHVSSAEAPLQNFTNFIIKK